MVKLYRKAGIEIAIKRALTGKKFSERLKQS
jgi:hypothetical protein